MTRWTINYDNAMKNIEKRILCQPQTFGVSSRDNQAVITIKSEAGHVRMIEILTEVVMERVFNEVATKHMTDLGYTDVFIRSYLTRNLMNEIYKTEWFDQLEDRIDKELGLIEAEQDEIYEWDLDVFSRFQTHQLRKDIVGFMQLSDKEVKEQLIHNALNPVGKMLKENGFKKEQETSEQVAPLVVVLTREDGDIIIRLDEEWAYLASEMEESFAEVINQSAYKEESELYREYMEGIIFVFLSLIFPIDTYVVGEDEQKLKQTLESMFESIGIPTTVVYS